MNTTNSRSAAIGLRCAVLVVAFVATVVLICLGIPIFRKLAKEERAQNESARYVAETLLPLRTDAVLRSEELKNLDPACKVLVISPNSWGGLFYDLGRTYSSDLKERLNDPKSAEQQYADTPLIVFVMQGCAKRDNVEYPGQRSAIQRNLDLEAAVFRWPERKFLGNLRVTVPFFSDESESPRELVLPRRGYTVDEWIWRDYDERGLGGDPDAWDRSFVLHLGRLIRLTSESGGAAPLVLETDSFAKPPEATSDDVGEQAADHVVSDHQAANEYREWVHSSGERRIVAKFLYADGENVTIEREDGEPFQVPLSRFSDGDRLYVEQRALVAATTENRTWSDTTGKFKVEATLAEHVDAKVVLRRRDGSTVTVPVDRLSEKDQQYLKSLDRTTPKTGQKKVDGVSEDSKKELAANIRDHEARIWTNTAGTIKIEAKFVELNDGFVVIETTNGKIGKLPLDQVSQSDKDYLAPLVASFSAETESPTHVGEPPEEPSDKSERAEENTTRKPETPVHPPPTRQEGTFRSEDAPPRDADLPGGLIQNRGVQIVLGMCLLLAVTTAAIARLKCRSVIGWFLLAIVLPVASLIIVVVRSSPSAGRCETHPWFFGSECESTRARSMIVDSSLLPRLVAKSCDLDVGLSFLCQAGERLSSPRAWVVCRECADKIGMSAKEKRRARARLRSSDADDINSGIIRDLLGGDANWAYPPGEVLHGLAADPDTCQMITPNSFLLDNTIATRKSLQLVLLGAEQDYLKLAAAGVLLASRGKEKESRSAAKKAASAGGGVGTGGRFATTLLIGAVTGNVGMAVAGGGSMRGKDSRAKGLEARSEEYKAEAKQMKTSAKRLNQRLKTLESLPVLPGSLIQNVNKWGVVFPCLLVCLVGVLAFNGACLLVGPFALFFLVVAGFAASYAYRNLIVIQNALDTYPDVHPLPRSTFRSSTKYSIACLALVITCISLSLLPFLMGYFRIPGL